MINGPMLMINAIDPDATDSARSGYDLHLEKLAWTDAEIMHLIPPAVRIHPQA